MQGSKLYCRVKQNHVHTDPLIGNTWSRMIAFLCVLITFDLLSLHGPCLLVQFHILLLLFVFVLNYDDKHYKHLKSTQISLFYPFTNQFLVGPEGIEEGSIGKLVFIPKESPVFYNGNDDLFLKSPLTPIVKISTAQF